MRNCTITVAPNMSDETFRYLCEKAERKFGTDISFQRVTDETVLGGFILELDGTVYDLSLQTQLETLKTKMVYEEAQG